MVAPAASAQIGRKYASRGSETGAAHDSRVASASRGATPCEFRFVDVRGNVDNARCLADAGGARRRPSVARRAASRIVGGKEDGA
jgi:hypothetical protein